MPASECRHYAYNADGQMVSASRSDCVRCAPALTVPTLRGMAEAKAKLAKRKSRKPKLTANQRAMRAARKPTHYAASRVRNYNPSPITNRI